MGAAILAGCAQAPPRLTLEAAQNDEFFVPDALEAAGRRFFASAPRGSDARGLISGIGRDTLSSGSGTVYDQAISQSLALGAVSERPLTPHLSLALRAHVARGRSRYELPEGAGVLVDPITVRFSGVAVDVGAALTVHTKRDRPLSAQAELGAGVSAARVRTEIRSDLLDVRNRTTTHAGYVFVGLGARYETEVGVVLHLGGRVKYYPGEGVAPQAAIRLEF